MKRKTTVNSRSVFEGYLEDFIVKASQKHDRRSRLFPNHTISQGRCAFAVFAGCWTVEHRPVGPVSVTCSVNGAPADREAGWTLRIVPSAGAPHYSLRRTSSLTRESALNTCVVKLEVVVFSLLLSESANSYSYYQFSWWSPMTVKNMDDATALFPIERLEGKTPA